MDDRDDAPEHRIIRALQKARMRTDIGQLMLSGMDRATASQVASIDFAFEKVFGYCNIEAPPPRYPQEFMETAEHCAVCGTRNIAAFATYCHNCDPNRRDA